MFLPFRQALYRQFKRLETDVHQLNYLFWECTTRCNLQCRHCGSDCAQDSRYPDMPLDDFLQALDTIPAPTEPFTVVLTGGEPLLRKDIEACGVAIRQRKMGWGLVSNGWLYTPERHRSLLRAGLGALTISLDGLETSHNWLRNNEGSFAKAADAIALAAPSRQLNFDVVTCVNPQNINELEAIRQFLIERGVKAWRLFTIAPIGRAAGNAKLLLSPEQFTQLMAFISAARKQPDIRVNFSCESYVGPYEPQVRDNLFFCRAGINIGSVLIDGGISACPNIDRSFVQGNIYRDHFYDVWQNRYRVFRHRDWTKTGPCADCSDYKNCHGSGMHLWHGDKAEPLVCRRVPRP